LFFHNNPDVHIFLKNAIIYNTDMVNPIDPVALLAFAGEHPLPSVRVEETICVLQELARLIIDIDAANALNIPPYLKQALGENKSHGRAHLLSLLPTVSELVVSR
jgi:hypothetical protein